MMNLRRIVSISRLSLACFMPANSVAAENHVNWLNRHSQVPLNSLKNRIYLFNQAKKHPQSSIYRSLTIKSMHSLSVQKQLSQADTDQLEKLNNQADFYCQIDDYEEARKVFTLIIELLLKNGQTGFEYAQALAKLGQCCKNLGKVTDALDYYERAIKILDSLEGNHEAFKAIIQILIGTILAVQQNFDQAEKLLLEGAQVLKQTTHRLKLCKTLGLLGQINQKKEKYQEATRFFATQIVLLQIQFQLKGQIAAIAIDCLVKMSSCLMELGKYMEALATCMKVKNLFESEGRQKSNQYAQILVNISQMHRCFNQNQQSFEYIQKTVAILEHNMGKDHPELLSVLLMLGIEYFQREKRDQAFHYLQRSRLIMSNSQSNQTKVMSYKDVLFLVASLHRHKKNYTEALKCYQQALEIQLNDGQLGIAALSLKQMGETYFQIQDFTSSLDFTLRFLDMYKKLYGENNSKSVWIFQKIAVIYDRMGKQAESLAFFEMAKSLRKNQANHNPENK